jgi:hypothetical protein
MAQSIFDDNNDTLLLIFIIFLIVIIIILVIGFIIKLIFPSVKYPILSIFEWIFSIIKSFGNNAGDILNVSGDVLSSTYKFGINLLNSQIHDLGNLLKGQATPHIDTGKNIDIDISIQHGGGP